MPVAEVVLAGRGGCAGLGAGRCVVQAALCAVRRAGGGVAGGGMTPDAVAGHGQGEIAAAYVAGDAVAGGRREVVALRSKALVALPGTAGWCR